MSAFGWAQKETSKRQPGPLNAVALARLRMLDTATLTVWIDNSLVKIGQQVSASQRAVERTEAATLLADAEEEAAALVQALQELAAR